MDKFLLITLLKKMHAVPYLGKALENRENQLWDDEIRKWVLRKLRR